MNRADAPYLPLTPEVVDAHLRGEAHIGLYPLSDDDTCWWVAADFDKEAAMLDALDTESGSLLWDSGCTGGITIRARSSRLDLLRSCDLGIGRPQHRYKSAE